VKKALLILLSIMLLTLVGCKKKTKNEATFFKNVARVNDYTTNYPKQYQLIDYKERSLDFDAFVFNHTLSGDYLPLIWKDEYFGGYGIAAYVGDYRNQRDGEEEALTVISSLISGTLLGIDKSKQNGINYVKEINSFYSNFENIVLNNPNGSSKTTSMWYLLYPAILFSYLSFLYPEELELRTNTLTTIESWYQAYLIMSASNEYSYTGFDFFEMKPYQNDVWEEPDSAVGIAVLMYYGYLLTAEDKYLDASFKTLQYADDYFMSPMYEVLLYFAPFLRAKYNMLYQKEYDLDNFINDVFSGSSRPRGGWGQITGKWGKYEVNGLMGSITDRGGYAFSMNTFSALFTILPMIKYDPRYALDLGKWALHAISNSRYYFPDQTEFKNQMQAKDELTQSFIELVNNSIVYEGIRQHSDGRVPYFGGDAFEAGWGRSDLSLYSGSHLGFLAAIIEPTNVEGILKINLNKMDVEGSTYNAYLLYNPFDDDKTINYKTESSGFDLYDLVRKKYLKKAAPKETEITITANNAIVVLELPGGDEVIHEDVYYRYQGKIIGKDLLNINVLNYQNLDVVKNKLIIKLGSVNTNLEDKIKEVKVTFNNVTYTFDGLDKIEIKINKKDRGSKLVEIEAITEKGLKAQTSMRLIIK